MSCISTFTFYWSRYIIFFLHGYPYFYLSTKYKYFHHLWITHGHKLDTHTGSVWQVQHSLLSPLINNAVHPFSLPPFPLPGIFGYAPACVHVSVLRFLIRCQTWSLVSVTPRPFPLASPLLRCRVQQTAEYTSQRHCRMVACGYAS